MTTVTSTTTTTTTSTDPSIDRSSAFSRHLWAGCLWVPIRETVALLEALIPKILTADLLRPLSSLPQSSLPPFILFPSKVPPDQTRPLESASERFDPTTRVRAHPDPTARLRVRPTPPDRLFGPTRPLACPRPPAPARKMNPSKWDAVEDGRGQVPRARGIHSERHASR